MNYQFKMQESTSIRPEVSLAHKLASVMDVPTDSFGQSASDISASRRRYMARHAPSVSAERRARYRDAVRQAGAR